MRKRIAIFASGKGSNAENIIKYFKNNSLAEVVLVISNALNANVLLRAKHLDTQAVVITKEDLYHSETVLQILKKEKIDWIILAGFLWIFPKTILDQYPNKVINIHPALLPKYGGKGMYGMHIHRAVVENREKETGITIHYVNEKYDEGKIIFQAKAEISATDTPESIAAKIHLLEQQHFPKVIEQLIAEKP
ncbi:MAG: phosphoribosylglycinamide formyltransferase [Flavobacteriales bacterium]|nr:phosphoribosylglycinamide formyltransferase [Flavobacteriales bacterium]